MYNQIAEIKSRITFNYLLNRIGIKIFPGNFILSIYKEEKTPSLKIYPVSNSFYCFATNKGGDIIKFYADYFNLEQKQAIKELASICGINSDHNVFHYRKEPTEATSLKVCYNLLDSEKELFEERASVLEFESHINKPEAEAISIIEILNRRRSIQRKIFNAIYEYCIRKGIDERAYKYLTSKERGLTEESIKQFKLFSIHSVRETIEYLRDNFYRDEIIISGLFSKKYFLFTKHRIIIPYIENNEIAYLRGRYFFEGETKPVKTGKYISCNNWSLTLSPKRFFNIDLLTRLKPFDSLLITEGEFDCIITQQNSINSIAIAGVSNFPKNQIDLVKYYDLYLALDNDIAGEKALEEITSLFDKPIKAIKLKHHKDLTELLNEKN
ncbi:MAG: toprim domain-containing protein [Ignavibacteriales bacterium]|nr:MAG: toprim domain-containing protein [Ignavibacteriales bacterium]